jgi:hypothetical protein
MRRRARDPMLATVPKLFRTAAKLGGHSEESTHDRGLRDSVATRSIEWEGVLVGALDCAVTNTHCVGCIKSGCSDK